MKDKVEAGGFNSGIGLVWGSKLCPATATNAAAFNSSLGANFCADGRTSDFFSGVRLSR